MGGAGTISNAGCDREWNVGTGYGYQADTLPWFRLVQVWLNQVTKVDREHRTRCSRDE